MADYNTMAAAEKQDFIRKSISYHSGKMDLIPSISTSCLCNTYCEGRRKNNCAVCKQCYAARLLKLRKTLREKMERNYKFYTEVELRPDEIPLINSSVFRFESFGELQNTLQVKNYFLIAEKNKHCTFAIWTKNPFIIHQAMKTYNIEKPENMVIILSNMLIDNPEPETGYIPGEWTFADKYFSVFTKEYAAEHKININCEKHCIECMKCYSLDNKEVYINELLK